MTDKTPNLKEYHQLFVYLTDIKLDLTMPRLMAWERFAARFSVQDLRDLIHYIQRERKHNRPARSLNFRNLIAGPESLDWAEEDLSRARARRSPWQDKNRAEVMRATGRPEHRDAPARTAEQVIRDNAALEACRKWREQNL